MIDGSVTSQGAITHDFYFGKRKYFITFYGTQLNAGWNAKATWHDDGKFS